MTLLIVEALSIFVLGMLVSVPMAFWLNSFLLFLIGLAITLSLATLHVRGARRRRAATTVKGLVARALLGLAATATLACTIIAAVFVAKFSETPNINHQPGLFDHEIFVFSPFLMIVPVAALYLREILRLRKGRGSAERGE